MADERTELEDLVLHPNGLQRDTIQINPKSLSPVWGNMLKKNLPPERMSHKRHTELKVVFFFLVFVVFFFFFFFLSLFKGRSFQQKKNASLIYISESSQS